MNDSNSLRDKGNAWKLVYAAYVMVESAPENYEAAYEDQDGNLHDIIVDYTSDEIKRNIKDKEPEEIEFSELRYSHALNAFVDEYEKGEISSPFTYENYKKNKDIIATLEAYDLNVEQFWYAILAIYWFTQRRCDNVIKRRESIGEQTRKLSEYLQGVDKFTITVEGKKKLVIDDVEVISSIREFLETKYTNNERGMNNAYSVNMISQGDHLESASVQMWFSAERFLKLFESLELPTIRAIDSKVKYKDKWDKRDGSSGGNKTVSYNKMLLISRLMYFMKFTRNEAFRIDDDSLRGIVKQYKGFKLNTYNLQYMY